MTYYYTPPLTREQCERITHRTVATDTDAELLEAAHKALHESAERWMCCELFTNQTGLVSSLLQSEHDGFGVDDIENLYPDPAEWPMEQCSDPVDVHQWFAVSEWLCRNLRDLGEPVIDNDYGCWWGRTCCGQAIIMDGTLQRLAERIVLS